MIRRAAEQILLVAQSSSPGRVIGFSSLGHASSSARFARAVARAGAQSDLRTIFIDTTDDEITSSILEVWSPGRQLRPSSTDEKRTLDTVCIEKTEAACSAFNNVARARDALRVDLAGYDLVVFGLQSFAHPSNSGVNALAIACACDLAFLICPIGQADRSAVRRIVFEARAVGCPLTGLVADEAELRTPGADIARFASRFSGLLPDASRKLAARALSSELLN